MATIICKRSECMYNTKERCRCTAIGMEESGCDTYIETPEILKKHLKQHGNPANQYYCRACGRPSADHVCKHCGYESLNVAAAKRADHIVEMHNQALQQEYSADVKQQCTHEFGPVTYDRCVKCKQLVRRAAD